MNENLSRLYWFGLTFLVIAILEWKLPRNMEQRRKERWLQHFGLHFTNIFLFRGTLAYWKYRLAEWCVAHEWGLLSSLQDWPFLNIVMSVLIFDAVIYAVHIAFHKNALLWKIHQVHHTDLELDLTSGFRFHFLEIGISFLIKIAVVFILGPNPVSLLIYEVILSSMALFNHSNWLMPQKIENSLMNWIVTPRMHWIHHSVKQIETDSNYGNFLSIWDRLFKTYTPEPESLTLGLQETRQQLSLVELLKWPFKSSTL